MVNLNFFTSSNFFFYCIIYSKYYSRELMKWYFVALKAFLKAWEEACQWKGNSRVYIPSGTYLLYEVTFEGPCNGQMEFTIQGVLKAPSELSMFYSDRWIQFQHISGLNVNGGGTLDGQGAKTWPSNTCDKKINCPAFPTVSWLYTFINGMESQ